MLSPVIIGGMLVLGGVIFLLWSDHRQRDSFSPRGEADHGGEIRAERAMERVAREEQTILQEEEAFMRNEAKSVRREEKIVREMRDDEKNIEAVMHHAEQEVVYEEEVMARLRETLMKRIASIRSAREEEEVDEEIQWALEDIRRVFSALFEHHAEETVENLARSVESLMREGRGIGAVSSVIDHYIGMIERTISHTEELLTDEAWLSEEKKKLLHRLREKLSNVEGQVRTRERGIRRIRKIIQAHLEELQKEGEVIHAELRRIESMLKEHVGVFVRGGSGSTIPSDVERVNEGIRFFSSYEEVMGNVFQRIEVLFERVKKMLKAWFLESRMKMDILLGYKALLILHDKVLQETYEEARKPLRVKEIRELQGLLEAQEEVKKEREQLLHAFREEVRMLETLHAEVRRIETRVREGRENAEEVRRILSNVLREAEQRKKELSHVLPRAA